MVALVIVLGAVVVFAAGWFAARLLRDDVPETSAQVASPEQSYVSDVLERHPSGVVVADADGTVVYRNAAARTVAATHVGVLIDEAAERHLGEARGGDSSDEELELFGPPKRVVMIAGEPLPGGGAVVFVDDITERRRADRARTDFVANVSHELRTPIGALTVLAETLSDAGGPEVIDRIIERITTEADRASRTIDDLLELSEIEAFREREFDDAPVAQIVHDGVSRVGELAQRRNIAVSVQGLTDITEPLVVRGDARQLASAIGNLVENAVKYSDDGGRVVVDVSRRHRGVEIAVRDNGVGIPRQDLDRIFERFYRVDRARSRETGGTGLGLSILRHVAENHGGSVWVSSTEGDGSEFVVRLPLAGASDAELELDESRREEVG